MADQLSLRGGTTSEHATFTGANKEVTVDTTKKTLVVNDGATVGGHPLMRENASNSALALGSAGTPSLKFTGDTNTGIYSPGADQVAISTNGTGRLTVDTAATTSTLPVVHPLGAVGTPSITFTSDLNTGFWSPTADTLAASTAGSERMRLTSAGLLGLGTSSPGDLLHVQGSTSPTIRLGNSTVGSNASPTSTFIDFRGFSATIRARIEAQDRSSNFNGGFLNIGTANTSNVIVNAIHIDNAQRVGIGTTSPGSALEINAAAATSPFIAKINTAEAARVDSSARLLVGTSSAFNSGSTIEAAGSSGGVVTLTNTNTDITGANSVFGQINFYTADTSGGNTGIFAKITAESNGNFDGNGSRGMDLKFFTGNVTIGANTPTERLRITSAGVLQVADAGNIQVGTTTGTKIGTATTQKIGFYNATPVVQPTAVADATTAVDVITQLNALLAKLRTLGIIAT